MLEKVLSKHPGPFSVPKGTFSGLNELQRWLIIKMRPNNFVF